MAFDFKKEYKEFYAPSKKPEIICIPAMNFIAIQGKGNPNEEGGAYAHAVSIIYSIAYALKMSYKGEHKIKGFFEYVVPPLEGFWWQKDVCGVDYSDKSCFEWISILRLPDFVTESDFEWAKEEVHRKKKIDAKSAKFLTYDEGMCVQCMHIGTFDDEPATVENMENYAKDLGYEIEINDTRYHHEIYLSDPRKSSPDKQKTVLRHPVKKSNNPC